jgi:methionyl-tRNA synthetase
VRTCAYQPAALSESDGIDVSYVDLGPAGALGVGAAWARVPPGAVSGANQHDEIETWVILAGSGEVIVDGGRQPVTAPIVVQFEPFETHQVENTGDTDLVFASFFWRDGERASKAATTVEHRRFGERPVFVLSSPPTPNGDLHVGHLSGPFFGADVFVRFQRMLGVEAWHITGSDDYQSYVVPVAAREGRTPAETAAHYSDEIEKTFALMDIVPDVYLSNSRDPSYPEALRRFFTRLVAAPQVSLREDPALFDPDTGAYLYEVDVTGGCPACGAVSRGTVCEACREPNVSADLVEPRATASGKAARAGTLARYSLAFHELAGQVAAQHRLGRIPPRVKELAGRVFQRERLDLAITHPADWGIRPDEPGVDGQMIWAWVDVACFYLHGIELLGRRLGREWRADAPQSDWKIVHFLGADCTFFHPILHPAIYRLVHPEWTPDIDVNINEFYLLENAKFSTTRGHVIWGRDILSPETVDGLRFYLALTRPEGRQTNFARAAYEAYVRDTLAGTWERWLNDLGERIEARYGGVVRDAGIWTPDHWAFLSRLETRLARITGSLGQDGFSLNRAAEGLNGIVEDALTFSRLEAPLAEIETWKDEARTAIALELAAAKLLAACSAPVMPRFAARLAAALGQPAPTEWPRGVTLVPPGTRVELANAKLFGAPALAEMPA